MLSDTEDKYVLYNSSHGISLVDIYGVTKISSLLILVLILIFYPELHFSVSEFLSLFNS